MNGTIWRWDRLDTLTPAEYEHWLTRPLPYGWSIIRPPVIASTALESRTQRRDGAGDEDRTDRLGGGL